MSNVGRGQPPWLPPAATSTWDDWLAMRPRPEPPAGENHVSLSAADFFAEIVRSQQWELLDFSQPEVRDALRTLFEEFERDTAGQPIANRDPSLAEREIRWSNITAGHQAGRVVLMLDPGNPISRRRLTLSPDATRRLMVQLLEVLEELGEWPGPDEEGVDQ